MNVLNVCPGDWVRMSRNVNPDERAGLVVAIVPAEELLRRSVRLVYVLTASNGLRCYNIDNVTAVWRNSSRVTET